MKNKYYQKIFNQIIEKTWEHKIKKPYDNLTEQEYSYYIGSRHFVTELRKELFE